MPMLGHRGPARGRRGQAQRTLLLLSAALLASVLCSSAGPRSWMPVPKILFDREDRPSGSSGFGYNAEKVAAMKVAEMRKALGGGPSVNKLNKEELRTRLFADSAGRNEEPPMDYEAVGAGARAAADAEPMDHEDDDVAGGEAGGPSEQDSENQELISEFLETAPGVGNAVKAAAAAALWDVSGDMAEYSESDDDFSVLSFGKHRGETYADVMDNDPAYCTWALQVSKASPESMNPNMKLFVLAILRANPDHDWQVVLFGKYKGKSFEETANLDPEYCGWVMTTGADPECESGPLLVFAEYLRQSRPDIAQAAEAAAAATAAAGPAPEVINFGKYKGMPFREVISSYPDYAKWVVGTADQEGTSKSVKAFAQFIRQNAPELLVE